MVSYYTSIYNNIFHARTVTVNKHKNKRIKQTYISNLKRKTRLCMLDVNFNNERQLVIILTTDN